jgi:hypothetical protein
MDEQTQEMVARSTRLETRPVKGREAHEVRVRRPSGLPQSAAFRRRYNRCHLEYAPGEGFSDCGEYAFYYDPQTGIVFGVCGTCGYVYIKPAGNPGPRGSGCTRYRGTISKRALAGVTGGTFG